MFCPTSVCIRGLGRNVKIPSLPGINRECTLAPQLWDLGERNVKENKWTSTRGVRPWKPRVTCLPNLLLITSWPLTSVIKPRNASNQVHYIERAIENKQNIKSQFNDSIVHWELQTVSRLVASRPQAFKRTLVGMIIATIQFALIFTNRDFWTSNWPQALKLTIIIQNI